MVPKESRPRASKASETSRYRALKKKAFSDFTPEQWEKKKHLYDYRCAYCGEKKKLTVDHVIPISKSGPHTDSNILPACASCNSKKGNRGPLPVVVNV